MKKNVLHNNYPRLIARFYVPLFIPAIASSVLFGFGTRLFAVVVTAIAADYFCALPEYSFSITEWEDVFAILGGLAALVIDSFREI